MRNIISNEQITFISDNMSAAPCVYKLNNDQINYFWHPEEKTQFIDSICFPLLGSLPENKYELEEKEYSMEMHGFAKSMNFNIIERSKIHIIYEIRHNDNTFHQYPYQFSLRVKYSIEETTLKTEYIVKNCDSKRMYFSIGGHPTFNCPIVNDNKMESFEDYYVEFENPESIQNIVKSYGPINVIEKFLSSDGKILRLDNSMFTKGCFCFHPIKSRYITLKSDKNSRSITMYIDNATHFQLWSVPNKGIISLEPWCGSITSLPSKPIDSIWKERPGTISIVPEEEFVFTYAISITN